MTIKSTSETYIFVPFNPAQAFTREFRNVREAIRQFEAWGKEHSWQRAHLVCEGDLLASWEEGKFGLNVVTAEDFHSITDDGIEEALTLALSEYFQRNLPGRVLDLSGHEVLVDELLAAGITKACNCLPRAIEATIIKLNRS